MSKSNIERLPFLTPAWAVAALLGMAGPSAAEFFPDGGRFEGELILRDVAALYVDDGDYDPGHTEFELVEEYAFIDADGREWRVPAGTVVNGASIPSAVWSWIGGPWSGEYRNASVIHDWMCVDRSVDSATTHLVFYEALIAGGVSEFRATVMYQAVLRGGPEWDVTSFGPGPVTRGELDEAELDAIIADVEAGRITPPE